MSDLQDLIATNAVRAYNEGFERGVASEQERMIESVEQWRKDLANDEPYSDQELAQSRDEGYARNFEYLLALIKGEPK